MCQVMSDCISLVINIDNAAATSSQKTSSLGNLLHGSSQAQSDALPLTRILAKVVCTTSDTNRNGDGQPTLHCLLLDNSWLSLMPYSCWGIGS